MYEASEGEGHLGSYLPGVNITGRSLERWWLGVQIHRHPVNNKAEQIA